MLNTATYDALTGGMNTFNFHVPYHFSCYAFVFSLNVIAFILFTQYFVLLRPETSQAGTLLDIGTRQIFSEEHDIFRENVRRFFTEEMAPHEDR